MDENKITELKQERTRLIGRMREILNEAEAESRGLTAEEAQEYDRIETDVNALGDRIQRLEQQELRELDLSHASTADSREPSTRARRSASRSRPAQCSRETNTAIPSVLRSVGADSSLAETPSERRAETTVERFLTARELADLLGVHENYVYEQAALGGDWPERAQRSALTLSVTATSDDDSLGVRLLADIRRVFLATGADKLFTETLIDQLGAIEDAPWGDWYGKPISPRKLSQMLKPFGVKPKGLRIGEETKNGYERAAFEEAWQRYLPELDETREPDLVLAKTGAGTETAAAF